MSEALYRKYRPQTFEDVVGQTHIERTLKNALGICGSQAAARPRQAAASSGETIGATTSSVPKRNSSGTS